ncbi:THUMP domain-containing class I SAM-dependent RNA methyltransferase [Parvicella tangerina]|uniref:Ribosomal RNA large subunit methyltransferase L n=1 Tax=Parvicella tangerina TaxID=2829795 RepID=A0A916JPS6_9FLAO|nr:THUMP domain-containing protein [Parvicella tangerina]CAG5085858.1 Ribosomal RNA large subunit methyltransferase L [Parvicella tangerina]
MKLIARTFAGLEELLEKEITQLGGEKVKTHKRAVSFLGDQRLMYKVNMFSRVALDVLTPIAKFEAKNPEHLYKEIMKIKWDKYMSADATFFISTIVYSSVFTHSQFVALKTKDAIVDQFREEFDRRPDIDKSRPDLRITIRVNETKCEVLLNSSGAPLFKRGYRTKTGKAPLNEILAAGIILKTNWDKKTPFIDPMCGSGTIPIEAGMIARNIAPCLIRKDYGFQKWKDYDRRAFEDLMKEAEDQVVENRVVIKGFDQDLYVLGLAKRNLKNVPRLAGNITLEKADFFQSDKIFDKGILVFNPPYDRRIAIYDADEYYSKIGTHLKHTFDGYHAWILSGNWMALKHVGLKPTEKITLFNGAEECKLMHYTLYQGSKKRKSNRN